MRINLKKQKGDVLMRIFYLLILIFILSSYNVLGKSDTHNQAIRKQTSAPEDLNLYNLNTCGNQSVRFVSLSDKYPVYDYPDWFAIPKLKNRKKKDLQYLILGRKYRTRFLSKTKISENDTVFIYDYSTETIATFPVKNLNAVACLSPYMSDMDDAPPYSQKDYMIGFEIEKKLLKNFKNKSFEYENSLIYIGKQNPFQKGRIKSILWKNIDPKKLSTFKIKVKYAPGYDPTAWSGYSFGKAYQFDSAPLRYYLQDLFKYDERYYIQNLKYDDPNRSLFERVELNCRRLIVINTKTKEIIVEKFYCESEGAGFAPLKVVGDVDKYWYQRYQWTGEIFKDRPPVIFGFLFVRFGCPSIDFLERSESYVRIHCDNRH
ncbi:hypothetical protein [Leptospira santarosai]|uniref:hypothetical protein n=1 Tax=Leptospira santarosai TaxID=28183 RepID=UPI00062CF8F6|nr:hypothetical protein [Leptospira santarosai]AVV78906.1 Uncharacterized protein XB15_01120 [Leptospira santarosai]ONF86053.1 hypothetical protein BWD13_11250 [Leptospira santarosai serovar Grippotyphosa]